ncbi:MAG: helicase [Proteobacteria bacterium]|nr:helicase [Pseudomonadota bacterium]
MPISFSPSATRDARARGAGVTAVLGPTNTGKTHLAIERMLGHSSGMIGLPLRLLAREVYNKVVARVGADAVALVTGEEKIKPSSPRYWVSTVEAMPRDIDVAFLAIDEVQLGADIDRGHVFTDRLLNRRGREETLVLGAATVKPLVERLLPGAHVLTRPRLSQLTFAGEKKLTRLPARSAIVAFSAEEVYAIAELVRRQRGGAAVVLGALSPRTRNAQVELYQSGEVDYLVATDAIGMGLNLDVDHVAFAADRKFDGYQFRRLNPAELAQIAGRAGRANRDGTFGTTGRCAPFATDLAQALESHAFEPLRVLQWRNTDLDFASLGALWTSLAVTPREEGLTRAPIAEDILVLDRAMHDDDVRGAATTREAVAKLWDVCQVPDYRRISPATHAELAITLFGFLAGEGNIPDDWFVRQIALADHCDGDIDTLSTRIAHIRTWTFVANRPQWLKDPEHWQGVTRAVEDRLSDALHERLTERFVDRRTSVLMKRLRENTMLETEISKTGDVKVEGHLIGRLDGFRFVADSSASAGTEAKALSAAAQKVLAGEIDGRATRLSQAPDSQFVLASDATLRWLGEPVAKLAGADNVLRPRARVLADEHLSGASLEAVQTRLDLWLRTHVERLLAPLFTLAAADDITGIARGVAYQIVEALGVIERQRVAAEIKGLDQPSRAVLRRHGVRFGAYHIYLPALLKPAPRALAAQLWMLKFAAPDVIGFDELQHLATSGRTSFKADKDAPKLLYRTIGYRVCGERAVRVDILERLADLIRPALAWRAGAVAERPPGAVDGFRFVVTGAMTSLAGCSGEDFASVLRALGYRMERRPRPPDAPAAPPPTHDAVESGDGAAAAGEGTDGVQIAPPTETTIDQTPADAARIVPPGETVGDVAQTDLDAALLTEDSRADQAAPTSAVAISPPEGAGEAASPDAARVVSTPETVTTASLPRPGAETVAGAPADEEPQFIEVWRPGRPQETGRPPRRRDQRERTVQSQHATQTVGEPGESASATATNEPPVAPQTGTNAPENERGRRPRRRNRPNQHRPGGDRAAPARAAARDGAPRGERTTAEGHPDRGNRDRRRDRRDRHDDERAPRTWASVNDRRGSEPDPDSPFAKLAALKAQLEAGKEQP